jgi:trk system potassium uptake protein TrkH
VGQAVRRPVIPTALRLVAGLAALVLAGTLLLMLPGVGAQRGLQWNEALFTATSALAVTGLSIITPARDLTLLGQVLLLILIQIGGLGFMVGAVVILRLIGRRMSLEERLALKDSLGLLEPGAIIKLTKRVLITVLLIEATGATLLWLRWRTLMPEAQAAFYAIFHAGFDLFSGTPQFPNGMPNDTATLGILGTLICLGSLGIPVLGEVIRFARDRVLSLHTRITLVVVGLLIAVGGLSFFVAESQAGGVLAEASVERRATLALFQSVSARTAGFIGLPAFETLAPASQLTLMALMFIGSAPASMGGGITTGTFAVLALALWGYARGQPAATVGGRTIAAMTVRKAAAVLTLSLFVIVTATWLILLTHPTATLDAAVFEVVSAFATCGLTLAFTSELNLFGQLVIVLVMFWGRLGALTVVAALAQLPQRKTLIEYPEEPLLIG